MQSFLRARLCLALLVVATACSSTAQYPAALPPAAVPAAGQPAASPPPVTEAPEPGRTAPARRDTSGAGRTPAAQPAPLTVADKPRRLAEQLLSVERTIRSPGASEVQLETAGHLQQLAYRRLGERPRWDRPVLSLLPRWLRPAVRANVRAHRQLAALSATAPPRRLPEWRIVAPAPRQELLRHYRTAQRRFGVRWEYLAAINLVETRMGRIKGTSTAGAQGPMQFIRPTWRIYGRGDIRDDRDAILAAGRYLRARGAPRHMARALYSYNNDVRYVRAVAAYARVMQRDVRAYRGYYHWQVYYRQRGGPVLLPVGYDGR